MTTVVDPLISIESPIAAAAPRYATRAATVALFGLGQVGSAFARLVATAPPELGRALRISGALVRNTGPRTADVPVFAHAQALLDGHPDVIVEVLGGLEPARTLVLDAIRRGIPVVTANKSLLAVHGDELLEAAWRARVPLRYEATVVAGVPFLGTFDRRPLAGALTELSGIVNGTSHFILSKMETGCEYAAALADAQRLGYAERDPHKDIAGIDASEKLAILIRHFARTTVSAAAIPAEGIDALTAADLTQARELGGAIKPVVYAHLERAGTPAAFAGPAFVPARHPLATLTGVANGVCLRSSRASLFYSGPGAGPDITAATILDDIEEVLAPDREPRWWRGSTLAIVAAPAERRWLLCLRSQRGVPAAADIADLLAADDVWTSRITEAASRSGFDCRSMLTLPCARARLTRAIESLEQGARCEVTCLPILEDSDER